MGIKKDEKKSPAPHHVLLCILLAACAISGAFFCRALYIDVFGRADRFSVLTTSDLEKVIDISELSTAKYTYNGIARVYADEEKEKVTCSIKYSAKVKAGIDMSEVDFEIDNEEKTVTVFLPPIRVTSDVVDEESISFIPDNAKLELKDALTACEEDIQSEAEKSEELYSAAEDNLKSTLEGLLLPILDNEGYKIRWGEK